MTPTQRAAIEQALGCLVRAESMYGQPNAAQQDQLRAALAEPAPSQRLKVDDLAQEIRRIDGSHRMGAGALAEALMPFVCKFTAEPAPVQEPDVGLITRDCCELDPEDPDAQDAICINVRDLTEIIKHHTTPQAQQPAPPADVPMLTDEELKDAIRHLYKDETALQMSIDITLHEFRAIEKAVHHKAGLK